jgi:hypothetical protein
MFGRPDFVHFDNVSGPQGGRNSAEAVPCSKSQTIKHTVDPGADLLIPAQGAHHNEMMSPAVTE